MALRLLLTICGMFLIATRSYPCPGDPLTVPVGFRYSNVWEGSFIGGDPLLPSI